MFSVSIVDSQPVFAVGLAALLASEPGLEITEMVGSLEESHYDRFPDDRAGRGIVIVDVEAVPGPAGERLVELRTRQDAVLLTYSPTAAERAMRLSVLGVAGRVARVAGTDAVLAAVRAVVNGGFVSPAPAPEGSQDAVPDATAPVAEGQLVEQLSPREYQVLQYIAIGRTHDQIARRLGISRHTVDTYVKRIRFKLQLGNKAELTRAAMRRGAVPRAS